MPQIEIVPNSTSISAPGWAYVPDNGYDPSKLAIQPTGARKRAARTSGIAGGDTTTRQQNVVLKHLAELDKDNQRDVQISLPAKHKDSASRGTAYLRNPTLQEVEPDPMPAGSKSKVTQNVRRILASQKTFANHLADEEASLSSQDHNLSVLGSSRTGSTRLLKTKSVQKRSSSAQIPSTPTINHHTIASEAAIADSSKEDRHSPNRDTIDDDPLLKTYVPSAPSEAIMDALLSGAALSYNSARAAPSVGKPQRRFCEICGYWGTIKCLKCGARVCGLECRNAHGDGRCLFYS